MSCFARRMIRSIFISTFVFSVAVAECLCESSAESSGDAGSDARAKQIERIRQRAEQGYIDQQIELAAAYLTGKGVPQDTAMAAHWYEKAALGGDPEAENEIGYFYQKGIGVRVDQDRAFHWFQLSSASGLVSAKVNLGVSYLYGFGTRKNAATARQLFIEAAKKGAGTGATYIAIMNLFGIDTPADKVQAENWLKLGVRLHDPEAAYDLAYVYCDLNGNPHDLDRAVDLLRLSASRGFVPAKHSLGLLLVNHPELTGSGDEARLALEEASRAGSWKSSVLLGILARDGRLVKLDPARALYYFHLGALQGGEPARRLLAGELDKLNARLSSGEQAAAVAQADQWFEHHRTALMFVFNDNDRNRNFPLSAIYDSTARPPSGQ